MKIVSISYPSIRYHSTEIVLMCACILFILTMPALAKAQEMGESLDVSSLITRTNHDRAINGVGPVSENALLDAAAQRKADDMMARGYFSHVSPEGMQPWHWIHAMGYQFTHAGENIASHFNSSRAVEDVWMASPTHRANIVGKAYTNMGIGISHGLYQGIETTFVVEFFAAPAPSLKKVALLPARSKVKVIQRL